MGDMSLAVNMSPFYKRILGRRTRICQINLTAKRGGREQHFDFLANFNLLNIILKTVCAAEEYGIMSPEELRQLIVEAHTIVGQNEQVGIIGASVRLPEGNVMVEVKEVYLVPGIF